jgi:hypothetical protein
MGLSRYERLVIATSHPNPILLGRPAPPDRKGFNKAVTKLPAHCSVDQRVQSIAALLPQEPNRPLSLKFISAPRYPIAMKALGYALRQTDDRDRAVINVGGVEQNQIAGLVRGIVRKDGEIAVVLRLARRPWNEHRLPRDAVAEIMP